MKVKPGVKTTEFWGKCIVQFIGVLVLVGIIPGAEADGAKSAVLASIAGLEVLWKLCRTVLKSVHGADAAPEPNEAEKKSERTGNPAGTLAVLLTTGFVVLAASVTQAGCQAPASMERFAATNRQATAAIAESCATDHVLLGVLLDASLQTLREERIGSVKRELFTAGYLLPGDAPATTRANPDKLRADLGDASVANTLIVEVRTGRMSADRAATWLSDYAACGGLSDADTPRRALIAALFPIRSMDVAAEDLRAAHAERVRRLAAAFDEVDKSAAAILTFAQGRPVADAPAVAAGVVQSLPAGPRRDAALSLLELLAKRVAGK